MLWSARGLLERDRVLPAINESLAATACLGTQELETEGSGKVEGVFALWYETGESG
jgi:indolepyruvate ferredoxin oxidoreductase